ncbi:MAG TPA: DUF2207 domain-containing protein [Gemmatimonadaceae bacterium]
MSSGGGHFSSLLAIVALIVLAPALSLAQDTGWTITSFESRYTVRSDRSIDVVERIAVDFGRLQRHGIYREIPVRYRKVVGPSVPLRAGTVKVDLDVDKVTDGAGQELRVKIDRGDRVRIRIGDADRMVSGQQTYVVYYRLSSGLGFFDDHDELYWQVTGTEWPVPILRASATVSIATAAVGVMPANVGWSAWCYAGWAESSSSDRCTAKVVGAGEYRFESGRLDPGEGLTLVAAFPKGVIPSPTRAEEIAAAVSRWWPVGIPIVALILMSNIWRVRGREPSAGSIVPVWHRPDGIPPGAAGTLLDQRADMDDIVATLLDLAVRGYLEIREVPPDGILGMAEPGSFAAKALHSLGLAKTDWELERTDKPESGSDLTAYEKQVLDGVFEGSTSRRMSDLHNEFYTRLPAIQKGMYEILVSKGYFRRSPETVRNTYRFVGVLLLIAGVGLGIASQNWILAVGLALAAIVVLAFSAAMPAMTIEGARRWREIKGLEEYIRRAEKLELEFAQSPERTTKLFETLLPYAVALDVSDIWVKQFATVLASSPPTWYTGSYSHGFSAQSFQSGLGDFRTAATRTMGSSPGSSSGSGGGGSVGGGGGGGGGGSW